MNLFFNLLVEASAEDIGVNCGGLNVPTEITSITSTLYTLVLIGVPIILVVFGMLDFGKAVMAGKEDDIKSSQKLFVKRLISAVAVFLIFALVRMVVSAFGGDASTDFVTCMNGLISGTPQ